MAHKPFAQINTSLPKSKKMRSLKSGDARYAYLCSHFADQTNYIGIFNYPKFIWAHDAMLGPDEIDRVIKDLVRVGLVEYDHEEEVVRIVAWFHKKNAPQNASHAIGIIADFQRSEFPRNSMFMQSIAEFVVSVTKQGLHWEKGWELLRPKLGQFLRQLYTDEKTTFLDAIIEEAEEKGSLT